MIKIQKKTFDALTAQEIYHILNLRLEVFLIEQNIIYVDTDYVDQKSIHYFIEEDEKIVSYLRLIPKGYKYIEYSIGRVVTDKVYRHKGYSTMLIKAALKDVKGEQVRISGQAYLQTYYEKLGFKTVSDAYIEEGILHYEMLNDNK